MPRSGPTAFVLAGGGTKGSFEVGALQYLVCVEGILPDIITATSAGALAATVLAQGRTREEFALRVQEIDDDILAMTRTEYVFGRQGWLRALHGTSLGGSIEYALTEGTRPPFPRGQTPTEAIAPSGPTRKQRVAAANADWLGSSPGPACAFLAPGDNCAPAVPRYSISSRWPKRCGKADRAVSGPSTPR